LLAADGCFESVNGRHGVRHLRLERIERVDELRHRGVRRQHPIGTHRHEELTTGRLVGVEHPEQATVASVHRVDERARETRPAVADDERAVVLVERERWIHDHLTDAGASVVGEVPMEALDPCLRREDEGDLRLGHPLPPRRVDRQRRSRLGRP
jgi:hypothetical protein